MKTNFESKIKIAETKNDHPIWKNAGGNYYIYMWYAGDGAKVWSLGPDYNSSRASMHIPGDRYQKCPYSSTNERLVMSESS